MFVKQLINVKRTAQIGTNVTARVFKAALLARSQFASGRCCDRPTRSKFCVIFLSLRENAELVLKFHVALNASHAALPRVIVLSSDGAPHRNKTATFR
jgi:hypothetical protein